MDSNSSVMELKNISKNYQTENEEVSVLKNLHFTIKPGKLTVVMGPSGSGKSTLMNLVGLLDRPSSGEVLLEGQNVSDLSEDEHAYIRSSKIGFIFQDYNLFSHLTALENVIFPLYLEKGLSEKERKSKGEHLLQSLSILDRKDRYPKQLSGGEQQRVAIARSLVTNPDIILADEPTGNVDTDNELSIIQLLQELTEGGRALVVVTHNDIFKEYADHLYIMRNGSIQEEILV